MKSTLKKLLIAAGICVASTSTFAATYFAEIINHSGRPIYANYEEMGSQDWDGSNGGIDGAKEMTYSSNTWIADGNSDRTATRDFSSTMRNSKDVKYFSITLPVWDANSKKYIGRKVIFHITNEEEGSLILRTWKSHSDFAIGSNYVNDAKLLYFTTDGSYRNKVEITVDADNGFTVRTGNSAIKEGWDNPTAYSPICNNNPYDTPNNRCFWHIEDTDGNKYSGNFSDSYGFNVDLPSTPTPARSMSKIVDYPYDWNVKTTYRVKTDYNSIDNRYVVHYPAVSFHGEMWYSCESVVGFMPGGFGGNNSWKKVGRPADEGIGDEDVQGCPLPKSLAAPAPVLAAAAPVQAPQGTYNFGQWKAGEYPVIYSPKEVHPFVTYNGKGYVACSGDTTAKDVPGKSDAWKEVNGTLGNTCGYTVHSAKKQSTTPSIAKSGASFW